MRIAASNSSCNLEAGDASHFDHTNFSLFPNPSKVDFTLNTGSIIASEISVFNTYGCRIKFIKPAQNQLILDMKTEPPGVYFIQVKIGESQKTSKLIKL